MDWLENCFPFPSYGTDEHPVFMNKDRLPLVCSRNTVNEVVGDRHTATQNSLGCLCLTPPLLQGYHLDLPIYMVC